MKSRFTLAACAAAALFAAPNAFAAEADKPTQQSKFATCAHESKGLKGDEHQKFMSDCLKGRDVDHPNEQAHRAAADAVPHHRMKDCNDEAGKKNLHGDERRAFMSTCLKS
jgi:hypothetical protein